MTKNTVTLRFSQKNAKTEDIKNILKLTSDYQHDNITVDAFFNYDAVSAIIINIYTEDTNDMARTRGALHSLVDYLLDN